MRPTTAKLLIFALVLLVAVALINLAQNLQLLSFGEVEYGLPRIGFDAEGVDLGIDPLVLVWLLGLVAVVIFLVAYLWKGDWKGRFPFMEFLPLILGGLLLFSIIYVTSYLAQTTPEAEGEGGLDPEEGPPPGEGDPNANDPLPVLFRGDFRLGPGSIALILAFLAFAAVYLLMSKHRFLGRRRDLETWRRERELREKVTGVMGERIYRLELGEDIRSVILGAYRDMVNLFRSYGVRTAGFQTAREVEAVASHTLGLSGEASTELRRRFEEARYSVHPLTEDQRKAAIESLCRVRRELGA
ncbi:MAG: DUF4129 domain-containing protein [Thermoplasmata archaeon]